MPTMKTGFSNSDKNLVIGIVIGSILRYASRQFIQIVDFQPIVPFDIPLHMSYDHILECKFLKETLGLDMYNVGNVRHSCHAMPIIVSLFQYDYPFLIHVFVDIMITLAIYQLANEVVFRPTKEEVQLLEEVLECHPRIRAENAWLFDITSQENDENNTREPMFIWNNIPILLALLYFNNPFTVSACCFRSTQPLCFLLLVMALLAARKGASTIAAACTAFSSYIELYSFTYLIPLALMLRTRPCIQRFLVSFVLISCLLYWISFTSCGKSWNFLQMTHGWGFKFMDLEPNISVLWYHFMMTFSRFNKFFVVLMSGLPFIFFLPLSIRMHKRPLVQFSLQSSIWSLCKLHPTCNEYFLFISFFLLSPSSVIRMRTASVISLVSMIVPLGALFVDYWLWLAGTGNANYLFFMDLTFMVFGFTIIVDFTTASMKHMKAAKLSKKTYSKGKGSF